MDATRTSEERTLLEGKTLGLGDDEVGEDDTEAAGSSPKEEDLDSEVGSLGTAGERKQEERVSVREGTRREQISKDSLHTGGRRVDEVGSSVSDSEVPEPVAGEREGREARGSATRRTSDAEEEKERLTRQ